jgi:AcrR family transcriptional regulator
MVVRASKQLLRRQETRRRLIEAAMQVWARYGYEACAVDEVARQAGVSKGAVYFHFRSKEDLLLEVVELQLWRDQQRVLDLATAEGPILGLRTLLDPDRTLSETDPWPRLLQEFWCAAARSPSVANRLQEMYQKRREILSRHLAEQFQSLAPVLQMRPEEVCSLFLAALDGVMVQQASGLARSYSEQPGLQNGPVTADDTYEQPEQAAAQRQGPGYRPAAAG